MGDTELKVLETFIDTVNNKYKTQVAQDHASLSANLRVLENLINTVRGIVGVQQTALERRIETQNSNFQNRVAIIGVRLGAASTAASAVANFVKDPKQPQTIETPSTQSLPTVAWSNFWFAFLFSIGIGVMFSLGTWGILALARTTKSSRFASLWGKKQ